MGVHLRYCAVCDDVLEGCEHLEKRGYSAAPAVSVPFKPGHFWAIGGYAGSERELREKAARKGITLAKDQLP